MELTDNAMCEKVETEWLQAITGESAMRGDGRNKLRTYRHFKHDFNTEGCLRTVKNRQHRSALAKFRCGVAPIQIELGRYGGVPENERLCPICLQDVESETHVLIDCDFYQDIRSDLMRYASTNIENFRELNSFEKLCALLSCEDVQVAGFSFLRF